MMKNSKVFIIFVLIFLVSLSFSFDASAAEVRGFLKTDFVPEDTFSKGLTPNVLLLLDASTAMTFAPWVPVSKTAIAGEKSLLRFSSYGQGMRPPLFGSGTGLEATSIGADNSEGMSYATNSGDISRMSFSRFGREIDKLPAADSSINKVYESILKEEVNDSWRNNIIGDPNCYYTSDPEKIFLLTFKNRYFAHYKGWVKETGVDDDGFITGEHHSPFIVGGAWTDVELPNSGEVGHLDINSWIEEVKSAYNNIYLNFKKYIPKYYVKNASGFWVRDTRNGKNVSVSGSPIVPVAFSSEFDRALLHKYLVPNDSRLYKMKLALWNLTGGVNKDLLSNLNVAAAMTYQDIYTGEYGESAPETKISTNTTLGDPGYYGANNNYKYGHAAPYLTGESKNSINGQEDTYLKMSQWTRRGIDTEAFRDKDPGDSLWKSMSRAIMFLPFDKLYERDSHGVVEKTDKLDVFMRYIDGQEHYKTLSSDNKADFNPINDEVVASSPSLMSPAIYGGRSESGEGDFPYHYGSSSPTGQPLIQFATGTIDNAGSSSDRVVFLEPSEKNENLENGNNATLKTGQAIGSVFDFFNPPDSLSMNNNTAGFFPVTGSCQQNWLVVFTAGGNDVTDYSLAEAAKKLFQNTRTMRGRVWSNGEWSEKELEMDSGVRTIVVGIFPEERKSLSGNTGYSHLTPGQILNSEPLNVKGFRKALKEMAQEGDPVMSANGEYKPNPHATPYLVKDVDGISSALNNIFHRIYVEQMGSGSPVNLPSIIETGSDKPNERIVFGASYKMNNLDQWSAWLRKYRVTSDDKSITSELEWEVHGGFLKNLYTIGESDVGSKAAKKVSSINDPEFAEFIGIPADSAPDAFKAWLQSYDENDNATELRTGVLGDMIHSGITVVGKPKSALLSEKSGRMPVIYTQTNRGVLHAFTYGAYDGKIGYVPYNVKGGKEIWSFIPPNVFRHKLKKLKYDFDNTTQKWKQLTGNGHTDRRSNPMYLLDGMLIARDIGSSTADAKTILTGYLGNGGNGFYTMDITDTKMEVTTDAIPKFMWAVENARYADEQNAVVNRWGDAAIGNINRYDYSDLGLTIVPGVYLDPVGPSDDTAEAVSTIGILPGGLGHKLGVNDSQGKAFYFFNPADGSIEHKIDTKNSNGYFKAPQDVKLGMGISPVVYHENSAKKAIEFYTADSEGNILSCNLADSIANLSLKSIFQFRTLGTDKPVAVTKRMALAKSGRYYWLMGGTSDLYAPGSGFNTEDNSIRNEQQFIFGLNTTNLIDDLQINNSALWRSVTPNDTNVRRLTYYDGNMPDEYGTYGEKNYDVDPEKITPDMDDFGWVLRLRPTIAGQAGAEYLSAEPYFFNGALYVATFIPRAGANADEICSDIGTGKLYVLDPSTGTSVLPELPSYVLENIKIAGITGMRDRLTISVKELKAGAQMAAVGILGGQSYADDNTLIDIPAKNMIKSENNLFQERVPHVQYWRERF